MFKPRSELMAMLDQLEKELPEMLKEYPVTADFWPAFCGKADVIEDSTSRDDYGVVRNRIEAALDAHGLTRGGPFPRDTNGDHAARKR